jgi:hypothetical protein
MIRRNEEKNRPCNRHDLVWRLSNGFGETNSERTDPPLLVDSISTRNQTNGPSNVPVRTSLATKSMPTPIYRGRQNGFSSENCKETTRSVSSSPTSTGTKRVRESPTYPSCQQGSSASLDRVNLPQELSSVCLDNVRKTIEIMPGLRVPLRGAEETWNCIEHDFFLPVTCFACTTELCCIQDASYVLCPVCRVVGPMDAGAGDFGSTMGVGLGFSFDDLFQWQSEIVRRQQDATPSCAGF